MKNCLVGWKKTLGTIAGLASMAIVIGLAVARHRAHAPPVAIVLTESVGPDLARRMDDLLKPYLEVHPDVRVSVRFELAPRSDALLALRVLGDEERRGAVPRTPGTTGRVAVPPAVPLFAGDFMVLAYNRALVPALPKTWQEIIAIASALKEKGTVPYGLAVPEDTYTVLPFFAGALWPARDIDREAASREAFELLGNLRFAYGLVPHACTSECATRLFADGRVPFAMIGEWRLAELRSALGDRLGVTAVPPLPASGAKLASVEHVFGLVRAPGATDREARAADDVARYLAHDARARIFSVLGKVPYPFEAKNTRDRTEADVSAVARDQSVDVSPSAVTSALSALDPVWIAFADGKIGAQTASTRLLERSRSGGSYL